MADSAALQPIAESNAKFSRDFFKAISGSPGNLVASPLSAQLVISLAQLGAKGKTASDMSRALCLPEDMEQVKRGIKALLTTLKSDGKVILEIANRMYVKHGFALTPEFVAASVDTFNSTTENVDFLHSGTPKLINDWVEANTQKRIKDLIPDGIFDDMTRLVLVNAVYFKGPWASPFKPSNTRPRDFYIDEETKVQTPFMYQKAHYGYAKIDELDAELLELPYEGNQLSLVILLPNKRTGLAELEKKMEKQDLSYLLQMGHRQELEVYLPKFKVESSINLKEPLKEIGMGVMFTNEADFSGISTTEPLHVSEVLQKTFIEVSEEGTEAAAATGYHARAKGARKVPKIRKVKVDHPFLFRLVQKSGRPSSSKRIVLFGGRLVTPPPSPPTCPTKKRPASLPIKRPAKRPTRQTRVSSSSDSSDD